MAFSSMGEAIRAKGVEMKGMEPKVHCFAEHHMSGGPVQFVDEDFQIPQESSGLGFDGYVKRSDWDNWRIITAKDTGQSWSIPVEDIKPENASEYTVQTIEEFSR